MKLNVGKIEKVLENLSKLATEIESIDFSIISYIIMENYHFKKNKST